MRHEDKFDRDLTVEFTQTVVLVVCSTLTLFEFLRLRTGVVLSLRCEDPDGSMMVIFSKDDFHSECIAEVGFL